MIYLSWFDADQSFLLGFDATISESHNHTANVTSHAVSSGVDVTDHVRKNPVELSFDWRVSDTPVPNPGLASDSFFSAGQGAMGTVDLAYDTVRFERAGINTFGQIAGLIAPRAFLPTSILGSRPTPVTVRDNASVWTYPDVFSRVYDVYAILVELQTRATLLRITTPIRDYDDFVLSDIRIGRDATTGSAPNFSGTFREIRIVESASIEVPVPREPRGRKRKNRGAQKPQPAGAGVEERATKSVSFLKQGLDNLLDATGG